MCAFTVLILAVSCGDDETPALADIVATWNFDTIDIDIKINDKPLVNFLMEDVGMIQSDALDEERDFKAYMLAMMPFGNSRITFTQDGKFEIRENSSLQASGTYTLASNNSLLTLKSGSSSIEYDVLELSKSRLVISNGFTENDDLTEDWIPEKIEIKYTMRLTR